MPIAERRHSARRVNERGLQTSFSWSAERILSGFVVDHSELARRFVVELIVDGQSVKVVKADEYVSELAQHGVGDACYGFSFALRDEIVFGGGIAEARVANVGTLVGAPIVFSQPDGEIGNVESGWTQWLGGLRFSGWLGENADEEAMDVVVDGTVVAQVEARSWTHIGADPNMARAVKAFDFHLPETFADGRVRRLVVVKRCGETLPGGASRLYGFCGRACKPRGSGAGSALGGTVRSADSDVAAVFESGHLA